MKEQEQKFQEEFEEPLNDTQESMLRKIGGNMMLMRAVGGASGSRDKKSSVKREVSV